tara:strand:- start:847 stop:1092 length:246 start_codon:yes stop_codon:yes gene_type:complete
MAGIRIEPIAAVVAAPDPEMAAKNSEVTMATIAKPPVILPTRVLEKSTRRRDIPPLCIKEPARMKKGIAINGKEFTEAMSC